MTITKEQLRTKAAQIASENEYGNDPQTGDGGYFNSTHSDTTVFTAKLIHSRVGYSPLDLTGSPHQYAVDNVTGSNNDDVLANYSASSDSNDESLEIYLPTYMPNGEIFPTLNGSETTFSSVRSIDIIASGYSGNIYSTVSDGRNPLDSEIVAEISTEIGSGSVSASGVFIEQTPSSEVNVAVSWPYIYLSFADNSKRWRESDTITAYIKYKRVDGEVITDDSGSNTDNIDYQVNPLFIGSLTTPITSETTDIAIANIDSFTLNNHYLFDDELVKLTSSGVGVYSGVATFERGLNGVSASHDTSSSVNEIYDESMSISPILYSTSITDPTYNSVYGLNIGQENPTYNPNFLHPQKDSEGNDIFTVVSTHTNLEEAINVESYDVLSQHNLIDSSVITSRTQVYNKESHGELDSDRPDGGIELVSYTRMGQGGFTAEGGTEAIIAAASYELAAEVESRQGPVFSNSWTNYSDSGGFERAHYYKDRERVYLEGLIKNTAVTGFIDGSHSNAVIFTLPLGYRPAASHIFAILTRQRSDGVRSVLTDNSGNTTNLIHLPISVSTAAVTQQNMVGRVQIHSNGQVKVIAGDGEWISLAGISFRLG